MSTRAATEEPGSPAQEQRLPVTFAEGVKTAAPIMLGYLPIGLAFGVLARTTGLSVAEVGLMSLLVYAGSAQFIGTGLLGAGAAAPAIISTTFLVNLRHLLMSTALVPSMQENAPWQNSLLAYGITDETFALNSSVLQGRTAARPYMAGVHLAAHLSWIGASVAGALVGQMAGNTESLGLDFALPAMFIGLLVPNFQGDAGRARWTSALVAGVAVVAGTILFPDSGWIVILATLLAATAGVMTE